jgi:hypothetical protein
MFLAHGPEGIMREIFGDVIEEVPMKLAEAFICKLYNQVTDTSDEARELDWVVQTSIKCKCQLKLN